MCAGWLGCCAVNVSHAAAAAQVPKALHDLLGKDAPDVGIEAVGLHYMKSLLHKVEVAMNVETDPSEMLNEIIYSTRPVRAFGYVSAAAEATSPFSGALRSWSGTYPSHWDSRLLACSLLCSQHQVVEGAFSCGKAVWCDARGCLRAVWAHQRCGRVRGLHEPLRHRRLHGEGHAHARRPGMYMSTP